MKQRPPRPAPTPVKAPRSAKPTLDLSLPTELRTHSCDPQIFNLEDDLAEAKSQNQRKEVQSGQLWHILPPNARVDLYSEDWSRFCPGIIREGVWEPSETPPRGPVVNKLRFLKGPPPKIDCGHWRPGIILGEPSTSWKTKIREGASRLITYGRAAFVPGTRTPLNAHGQLLLSHVNWYELGSYQFWQSWGVIATHEADLLKPVSGVSHVRRCNPVRREELLDGEDAYAAARRLLAEVIGARTPSRTWQVGRQWEYKRPNRWDVVLIDFQETEKPIPCVVISPQEFNEQSLDVIIVLQCIEYNPHDNKEPILLPLGEDGCLDGVDGRWSISVPSIRSITRASDLMKLNNAPHPRLEEKRCNILKNRLEYFYA